MKMINQESAESIPVSLLPLREIAGFPVRPGLYDMNGATLLQDGVNFTVHTHYGTAASCCCLSVRAGSPTPCCRSRRSTRSATCIP